jgi:hypothetical protein
VEAIEALVVDLVGRNDVSDPPQPLEDVADLIRHRQRGANPKGIPVEPRYRHAGSNRNAEEPNRALDIPEALSK